MPRTRHTGKCLPGAVPVGRPQVISCEQSGHAEALDDFFFDVNGPLPRICLEIVRIVIVCRLNSRCW